MVEIIKSFFFGVGIGLRNPLFIVIVILNILIAIYYKKIRGFMGEFWVLQELKKLPQDKYLVLNDILVENNGFHQIDHIVISKYGIFVIEMKNYYGLIIGNQYNKRWFQYLGKKKYSFYSPIYQNYGHLKVLEEILNIEEDKFISIICFSNQAKLKVESLVPITQTGLLNQVITSYQQEILDLDLKVIKEKLETLNIKDKSIRKKHIKNIKKTLKENKVDNELICPKCGSKLPLKKGKYGTFLGCENFPNCRYTKNI